MAYQETTRTGYGTRVKNSFGGIGMGFLLFIAGTIMLWWNEGSAVKTDKMLNESEKVAVHVDNVSTLDPSLEGKLIHASALATTTDTLRDEAYGVKENAIALDRYVEYYQWVEHSSSESKDKLGGAEETTTTYTYSKEWVPEPIDASTFHDPEYKNVKNGAIVKVDNNHLNSENVTFGAYKLPQFMITSISSGNEFASVNPTEQQLRQWDKDIERIQRQLGRATATTKATIEEPKESPAPVVVNDSAKADSIAPVDTIKTEPAKVGGYTATYVHSGEGKLYFGLNEGMPEVGDVRINFRVVRPHDISLMGVVQGNTFTTYVAKNGKKFYDVANGVKSMDEMFASRHKANTFWLWVFRVIGLILVVSGLKGIFGILTTLLKVVPFLSSIMGFGVSVVCGVLGFIWALLVAALAWLFYRPLVSICLLAVVAAVVFFFWKRGKNKKQELNGPTLNGGE